MRPLQHADNHGWACNGMLVVKLINTERAQHGRQAISQSAAINAISAKVDELT